MRISKNTELTILGAGIGLILVILPIAIFAQSQPSNLVTKQLLIFAMTTIVTLGITFAGIGIGLRVRRKMRGY